MEMIDLKLSEANNQNSPVLGGEGRQPEYPPGTTLFVDGDLVARLGLENCNPGDMLKLSANVTVSGVSERDGSRSVDLQLTHMGIGKGEEKGKAETLYGDD